MSEITQICVIERIMTLALASSLRYVVEELGGGVTGTGTGCKGHTSSLLRS
jgi:hypothetical protein